jgi:large subunit ribosomal protein L2
MRHKGGGHKHHYRIVDYKRDKDGIPAKVERLEYDPNRSAHLALLLYVDGERRYVIAPRGVTVGTQLMSAPKPRSSRAIACRCATFRSARRCIASSCSPGKGAQVAAFRGFRGAASRPRRHLRPVRLRSGEIRKVHVDCRAVIGEVGNEEHNLRSIGKAGANRWRGIRPTVRGISMNPVDHPMGGRGNGGGGRHHPMSPWGTPAKGYKTRRNKRTDSMIVRRRHATKG